MSFKYPPNFFQNIFYQLYKDRVPTIVQIGVCDGVYNDPIHLLIKKHFPNSKLILIEPQPFLAQVIKDNYAFNPNVTIESVAIGSPGELSLYQLKEEYYELFAKRVPGVPAYRLPAGSVSADKQHMVKRLTGNLPCSINIDEAISELKVPCINLDSLLSKYKISNYDLLQIDTEGFDDEVIYHSSIDKFSPTLIHFEYCHLNNVRLENLKSYLVNLGYELHIYNDEDALALKGVSLSMK